MFRLSILYVARQHDSMNTKCSTFVCSDLVTILLPLVLSFDTDKHEHFL